MPRNSDLRDDFNVYQFEVSITLRRRTSEYNSDTIATVQINRQVPLNNDVEAKHTLEAIVTEELQRTLGVAEARIDFDNRVKRLTTGDVIDA